jgi:hypothetical protein
MTNRKRCSKCEVEKDIKSGFYRNKRYADGFHSWCKECVKVNATTWAKKNPKRHNELNRLSHARRKGGSQ